MIITFFSRSFTISYVLHALQSIVQSLYYTSCHFIISLFATSLFHRHLSVFVVVHSSKTVSPWISFPEFGYVRVCMSFFCVCPFLCILYVGVHQYGSVCVWGGSSDFQKLYLINIIVHIHSFASFLFSLLALQTQNGYFFSIRNASTVSIVW